jgi:hypothetical protein
MRYFLIIIVSCLHNFSLNAQTDTSYSQRELIYGRKDGMALTLVMLTPAGEKNGKAIISLVSGGWHAQEEWIPY